MSEIDVKVLCDYTDDDRIRKISIEPSSLVCPRQIDIVLDGDIIRAVQFTGGCNGNSKGIAALVAGMHIEIAISRLDGNGTEEVNGGLTYSTA